MNIRDASLSLLAVVLSATYVAGDEPETVVLPPKQRFHLFLLVGQSNMAGRGEVESQDQEAHPRVLVFAKGDHWAPAVDPLHFDKPTVVGVGIGRTFGIEVATANPEITVGLIPCAAGGSPIASWQPWGYHTQTKSHPYDDALRRAEKALKSGVLKGILWHQGESDAHPGKAELYRQSLHELITRFRAELNATSVPFVAGQMGQFAERPWSNPKKLVDSAHRNLAHEMPQCAFVNSDGLTHKGDQVHFDSKSYRELGRRYAQAYREVSETDAGGK